MENEEINRKLDLIIEEGGYNEWYPTEFQAGAIILVIMLGAAFLF